jgi:hypothetical protein
VPAGWTVQVTEPGRRSELWTIEWSVAPWAAGLPPGKDVAFEFGAPAAPFNGGYSVTFSTEMSVHFRGDSVPELTAPAARTPRLASASWCGSFGCSWSVDVWADGSAHIWNSRHPHLGGRRTLTRAELAELKEALGAEAAIELSGSVGSLGIDVPVKSVSVYGGGRHSTLQIHDLPPGSELIYERDPSMVSRGLRVCEAIRRLVRDPTVRACTE